MLDVPPKAQATDRGILNDRIDEVVQIPGVVAFWDFVNREPTEPHRFIAHVPLGATNQFPLDAANYVRDYWSKGREATYSDFPLLGRGPFGQAIRIVDETDPNFRPLLCVPRERLHNSPLDIKGARPIGNGGCLGDS